MKVLVCVQGYPDDKGNSGLMFIHQRNLVYMRAGISVTVLNFGLNYSYCVDGIEVLSEEEYEKTDNCFDILILHAPNVRNHVRFLKKHHSKFGKFLFFFHGHEVVKINKVYPAPYNFTKDARTFQRIIRSIYDSFKLLVLKKVFEIYKHKSAFVFVSRSLFDDFQESFHIADKEILDNIYIINNGVGNTFVTNHYHLDAPKKYDFITIRSHFDSSVYCLDLLVELAKKNPSFDFLLIGRGDYFKYNDKPANLILYDKHMTHEEMMKVLDTSRVALMLTRRDSQGVMSCELATYGIPVFTSDLKITREIFEDMENVYLLDNTTVISADLQELIDTAVANYSERVTTKFYEENTVSEEVRLLRKMNLERI